MFSFLKGGNANQGRAISEGQLGNVCSGIDAILAMVVVDPSEADPPSLDQIISDEFRLSLQHMNVMGGAAARSNGISDAITSALIASIKSRFKGRKIRSEIRADVEAKLEYLQYMAQAFDTLNENLRQIGTATAEQPNKLRQVAETVDEFCRYEMSFSYYKSTSLWDSVRANQEAKLSEKEREDLRYFYRMFSKMAENATHHNERALADVTEALKILNSFLTPDTKAKRYIDSALAAIIKMGVAFQTFISELKSRFEA